MLFLVQIENHPDKADARREHLRAHLHYLDQQSDRILFAATLRTDPGQEPVGIIWIIEAADRSEAEKLCHSDPFWTAGLRKSVNILHLSKALPDRKALL